MTLQTVEVFSSRQRLHVGQFSIFNIDSIVLFSATAVNAEKTAKRRSAVLITEIGGGSGGLGTARRAASYGKKVVIIEKDGYLGCGAFFCLKSVVLAKRELICVVVQCRRRSCSMPPRLHTRTHRCLTRRSSWTGPD